MCDFDPQYETVQSPSLCYETTESDCNVLDLSLYTCPDGFTPLEKPIPGCKIDLCDEAFTYGSYATNLCTYAPPPNFDTKAMVDCCTYKKYSGGRPECPKGYCKDNQSQNSPCIIATNGNISMTEYCVANGLSDADCRNFLINTTSQYAREFVLSKVLNPMLNLSQKDKINNPANEQIIQICNNPNLKLTSFCDTFLSNYCSGIDDRKTIFDNIPFTQVCGCHLDKSVYVTSTEDPNGLCDPICNLQNTIPKNNQVCKLDVCLFDFDVVNTVVEGNINVQQVCGTSDNRCYFSDRAIDFLKKNNSNIDFRTNCKECFSYNEKDKVIGTDVTKIDCIGKPIPTPPTGLSTAAKVAIGVGAVSFIVFIILLFLI